MGTRQAVSILNADEILLIYCDPYRRVEKSEPELAPNLDNAARGVREKRLECNHLSRIWLSWRPIDDDFDRAER
jgi:hypothetical protein